MDGGGMMKITDSLTDMPEWFQFLFGWVVFIILFGWVSLLIWLCGRGEWAWLIVAASALFSLILVANRN